MIFFQIGNISSNMTNMIAYIKSAIKKKNNVKTLLLFCHFSNFVCMDVVTGGRDCPINSNKHTLQLKKHFQVVNGARKIRLHSLSSIYVAP